MKNIYVSILATIALLSASCSETEMDVFDISQQQHETKLPYTKANISESMEQILDMPMYIYLPRGLDLGDRYISTADESGPDYYIQAFLNVLSSAPYREKQKWVISRFKDSKYGDRYMIKSCASQRYYDFQNRVYTNSAALVAELVPIDISLGSLGLSNTRIL